MLEVSRHPTAAVIATLVVATASACGGGGGDSSGASGGARATTTTAVVEPVIDPGDGGSYEPTIDPAKFVDGIDNPYLPLAPGTSWVYEGDVDGEHERIEVTVTSDRKEVMGVSTVVVSDVGYVDGQLAARTEDWYAQGADGSVWYFGEATEEYEGGKVVDTDGSWEAGVDGAQPGVFMPDNPQVGDVYRQNYVASEIEDLAEVLHLDVDRSIGLGDYHDVIVTQEWSPLEPDIVEQKYYAPGVGKIYETQTTGGTGGTELTAYIPP